MPEDVRVGLTTRLEKHAASKWKRECRGLAIKFHGVHAYVDAYPARKDYPPGATKEQKAAIDATPVHLCRIEYLGDRDRWGFAFYKYSDGKYEVSILPSISWTGTPEECFDCAANVYLSSSIQQYVRRMREAIGARGDKR